MRPIFALLLLFALATFAPPRLYAPPAAPTAVWMTFTSVAVAGSNTGRLTHLGGWTLASNDPRFGGLSALHVGPDGVLAASDAGALFRFALPPASPDLRVALIDATASKGDRDIEALTYWRGRLWLAFETRNLVRRLGSGGVDAQAAPARMRGWRKNRGAEAMLRLADGRFLIFEEGDAGGTTDALLFAGDPAIVGMPYFALRYRAPPGYRITDAASLSDGRLLFLNRRLGLTGFAAKLTMGALPHVRSGALIEGVEIANLNAAPLTENLEALSVTRENGRDTVWIASDDNFSPLQRTLLLKFAIAD